jgi:hypothetical protein
MARRKREVTMNSENKDRERRRHPRVPIERKMRGRSRGRIFEGSMVDISASGASFNAPVDPDENAEIEMDIEDISPLSGRIARVLDDGFAVEFDLNADEEDRLLAEVMEIYNDVRTDEA